MVNSTDNPNLKSEGKRRNLNRLPDAFNFLGNVVRGARLEKDWTQKEMAHRAGISLPALQKLETGHTSNTQTLFALLRALGLLETMLGALPDPENAISPLSTLKRSRASRRTVKDISRDQAIGRKSRKQTAAQGSPSASSRPSTSDSLPQHISVRPHVAPEQELADADKRAKGKLERSYAENPVDPDKPIEAQLHGHLYEESDQDSLAKTEASKHTAQTSIANEKMAIENKAIENKVIERKANERGSIESAARKNTYENSRELEDSNPNEPPIEGLSRSNRLTETFKKFIKGKSSKSASTSTTSSSTDSATSSNANPATNQSNSSSSSIDTSSDDE